jgi:hypothetical protein
MNDLPSMVRNQLAALSPGEYQAFREEYDRRIKNEGTCYLLWFCLGWHYAYLGKWGLQVLFWLSGGGFLIWAVAGLFRIPQMVRDYNKEVAIGALRDLKAVSLYDPKLPRRDTTNQNDLEPKVWTARELESLHGPKPPGRKWPVVLGCLLAISCFNALQRGCATPEAASISPLEQRVAAAEEGRQPLIYPTATDSTHAGAPSPDSPHIPESSLAFQPIAEPISPAQPPTENGPVPSPSACIDPVVLYRPTPPTDRRAPSAHVAASIVIDETGRASEVSFPAPADITGVSRPVAEAWIPEYQKMIRENVAQWKLRPAICNGSPAQQSATFDFYF